jgi:DNA polymerase (family 10)
MSNIEIAKLLKRMSAVYTIKNENFFKIRAYEKAADIIFSMNYEIYDLWKDGKLSTVEGIGKGIGEYLNELFEKGKVKHFNEQFKSIPEGVFRLLDIGGIGPKTAYKLVKVLKLEKSKDIIQDLIKMALNHKIAKIPGFGDKSEVVLLNNLKKFNKGYTKSDRVLYPKAEFIAKQIINYLKKSNLIEKVTILGSLRRKQETIGDIDIAVVSKNNNYIIDYFVKYPHAESINEKGESKASIFLSGGIKCDLRICSKYNYGTMLQYFTGNKEHNIKLRELAIKQGLSLNEYGIKKIKNKSKIKYGIFNKNIYQYLDEKNIYKEIGLQYIEPELRQGTDEIELAKINKIPKLIQLSDIKGDLHIHSNIDIESSHDIGSSGIQELIEKALLHKYEYIGISDHNPKNSGLQVNQIYSLLKKRKNIIEQYNSSTKFTRVNLFNMLEIDILKDGVLALPKNAFELIDCAIISVHSTFDLDKNNMTNRIIKALSHPKAKILGHPTGRLINKRIPYELDWTKLFKFCHKFDKALEINSHFMRLDINELIIREAIKNRVKLVINTDSHNSSELSNIQYGVNIARRGWASKNDIINTWNFEEISKWLIN